MRKVISVSSLRVTFTPPESGKKEYLNPSRRRYTCLWKGRARYYDLVVEGNVNKDAVWSYFKTSEAAQKIKNYVAFDKGLGVKVEGNAVGEILPPRLRHNQAPVR